MTVSINKQSLQCFFHSVFIIVYLVGVLCPHLPAGFTQYKTDNRGRTANVIHAEDKPSGLPENATFAEDNYDDNWGPGVLENYRRQMENNFFEIFSDVDVRSSDAVNGFGRSGNYLRVYDITAIMFEYYKPLFTGVGSAHRYAPVDYKFNYLRFWYSPANLNDRIYLLDSSKNVIFEVDPRIELGNHWIVVQPQDFTFAGLVIYLTEREEGKHADLDEMLVAKL